MRRFRSGRLMILTVVLSAVALIIPIAAANVGGGPPGTYGVNDLAMADGVNGWTTTPIFTVGETIDGYTPPGVLDGLGAYELNSDTVRVFANHELLNSDGYVYNVDGIDLEGARITYFDIDKDTRHIVASGVAYDRIYTHTGDIATDTSFFGEPYAVLFGGEPGDGRENDGFGRFCSGVLVEAHEFGKGSGLEDRIYFAGEEDGGVFNSLGGNEWALDPATNDIWALPDLGRGAWENIALVDTKDKDTVAVILADDTSPYDVDAISDIDDLTDIDGNEAAPLFMYVGEKDPGGDFPARNGLRDGKLYAWVADNGATTPADFNTKGKLKGTWVEIDNSPTGTPSQDGSSGFDEYGYPTQATLWSRAEAIGAFGFSRPEDVATNPKNGTEVVMASTGVDTYAGGADTFGTMYKLRVDVKKLEATVEIIYDGDADPNRTLRSPDNLDWADDGRIYVQEDKAEDDTLLGEPLFGEGAVNPNEASIIRMNSNGSRLERIATVNRGVVLDASLDNPTLAFDQDYGEAGEWETSGILDVSELFNERKGTLFLFDVEAHSIDDQEDLNPESRIQDEDLKEGGQLLFLEKG